jgi:hypothetical protein
MKLTGALDPSNHTLLATAQHMFKGEIVGPESVEFDADGKLSVKCDFVFLNFL